MQRQGGDQPKAPERRPARAAAGAQATRERTGPRQYFGEVKSELKKVAWPTRREVINSSIVVLIAVIFMTGLIFALDYAFSQFVLLLFE
jgi:preprotein translocase subunit SecE